MTFRNFCVVSPYTVFDLAWILTFRGFCVKDIETLLRDIPVSRDGISSPIIGITHGIL
jgi:hypothetical protein